MEMHMKWPKFYYTRDETRTGELNGKKRGGQGLGINLSNDKDWNKFLVELKPYLDLYEKQESELFNKYKLRCPDYFKYIHPHNRHTVFFLVELWVPEQLPVPVNARWKLMLGK